ncbi:MAG: CHASE sensor domain-containing protein, partial [Janthinobacterium sp.]
AQLRGDRIARLNLVAAAAMLAAASLLLVLFQWFSLQASLQRNLQIQAGMLAPAASAALRQDNRLAAEQTLASLSAAPQLQQAWLYTPYGTRLARYARSGADAPPTAPRPGLHVDFLTGNAAFTESLPGGGALFLRTSLAQQYRSLAHFAGFTLLVSLCAFGLTTLMVRRTRAAAQHAENHLHY